MSTRRTYRVKDVARLAGVTVRTLHHYDALGLLVPSARSKAGYRLYDDADLLRLQQILIHRELGFPLEEIRRLLDDPGFDLKRALHAQREQLQTRARRAAEMIRAVDRALASLEDEKGGTMNMKDLFDGFDPAQYEDEARQRWGDTDAYRISTQRAKTYTEEDWRTLKQEQDAIYADAAAAMRSGAAPDGESAMDIAERARLQIDRWFYPCSPTMHAGLADLYESDPRFAQNIDKYGEGLTAFLSAAIRANARRAQE